MIRILVLLFISPFILCFQIENNHYSQNSFKKINPLYSEIFSFVNGSNICPDGQHKCPVSQTCCKMNEYFGCCPLENAVCCDDGIHCCPNGYVCETNSCRRKTYSITHLPIKKISYGQPKKYKHDITISTKIPYYNNRIIPYFNPYQKKTVSDNSTHIKLGLVVCGNYEAYCPDYTTCCQRPSKDWGCCPGSNAGCCPDGLHCCPAKYICDSTSSKCLSESLIFSSYNSAFRNQKVIPARKKLKSLSLNHISNQSQSCPNRLSICSSLGTCCPVKYGLSYGCCPHFNGVCCSTGKACCPRGYKCSKGGKSCIPK